MADVTLLHLTDLHFGWDRDPTMIAERHLVLDGLIRQVVALQPNWRPTVVCISGDIGWKGKDGDYAQAKTWLEKLLSQIGLGFPDVLVCAGNHDADRDVTGRLARPIGDVEADQILRAPIAEHNLNAFAAYSKFCQNVNVTAYHFQGKPSYLVGHTVLKGIRFVACNSAWFCKGEDDKNNLWLGLPLIKMIESEGGLRLTGGGADDPTFCLVHHPPDWLHESETNAYGSRPNTWDYLAHRCHLILSGHTHGEVRKANRIAQSAIHLTGGAGYNGPSHYNSFRLIRLAKDRLMYRSFEYDARSAGGEWRDHGVNTLPFVEGPPESTRVAPANTKSLDLDALREASKTAARTLVEGKSRQIRSVGKLPELHTFGVQFRVTEQVDQYAPNGQLRLDRAQVVNLPLEEAVRLSRRTVLLGDLGSGKSTLAGLLVTKILASSPTCLAFLIPARAIHLADGFLLDDIIAACSDYVRRQIAPSVRPVSLHDLLCEQESVTVVIDGLDEVPRGQAAWLVRQLATLTDQWPTLRILATGRPVELAGVSYETWGLCRVPSLGDIERLAVFVAEAISNGLGVAEAELDAADRLQRLRSHPNLLDVATTPLTTRLLWPRLTASSLADLSLGDLLHDLLQERLGRWDNREGRTPPANEFLHSGEKVPAERLQEPV